MVRKMRSLNSYIIEKFQVSPDNIRRYAYTPKEKIKKEGLGTKDKPLDLNDIDTSKITDMSNLFDLMGSNIRELVNLSKNGNFDISEWDVSNVTSMYSMFYCSAFNGDISNWDVSNVENMRWMFAGSYFDGNISKWDVSNVENMDSMFRYSRFTGKKGDISDWDVTNVKGMINMFNKCPLEDNPPKWYKL